MPKFYVEIFRDTRETAEICVQAKDQDEAKAKAEDYWKDQAAGVTHYDHNWDFVDVELDLDSIEALDDAPDDAEADI